MSSRSSACPVLTFIDFADNIIHRYYTMFPPNSTPSQIPKELIDDMEESRRMFETLAIPEDSFYYRWIDEHAFFGKAPQYAYTRPCEALEEIECHIQMLTRLAKN